MHSLLRDFPPRTSPDDQRVSKQSDRPQIDATPTTANHTRRKPIVGRVFTMHIHTLLKITEDSGAVVASGGTERSTDDQSTSGATTSFGSTTFPGLKGVVALSFLVLVTGRVA